MNGSNSNLSNNFLVCQKPFQFIEKSQQEIDHEKLEEEVNNKGFSIVYS
jgi:hypothetical protein